MSRATMFGLCLTALAGAFCSNSAGNPITPVAVEGMPAPGTGANFGYMYNLYINDNGQVTVKAKVGTGGGVGGLWAGDPTNLSLIVRDGKPAPGAPAGTMFSDTRSNIVVPIANDGTIVFGADIKGPGITDPLGVGSLWRRDGNSLSLIGSVGGSAAGAPGATYNDSWMILFPSAANGKILYSNSLQGPGIDDSNSSGLWEGAISSPTIVLRGSRPAPGYPDGVVFANSFTSPHINSSGQIAFAVNLAGPGITNQNSYTLWVGPAASPHLVWRSDDIAPGTSPDTLFVGGEQYGPHAGLGRGAEYRLNDQGKILFFSNLKGPGLDQNNSAGLWSGDPDGTPDLVARTGSQAPGTAPGVNFGGGDYEFVPGAGYLVPFSQVAFNNRSDVAFRTKITGVGVTTDNDEGLWVGPAGALHLIGREGDHAPGTAPGVVFARVPWFSESIIPPFDLFRLSDTGQVAFLAGLSGPGVDTLNDLGLWATDSNGDVQLIIRCGDLLDVGGGQLRRIQELTPESFNTINQVGFLAYFTDGTTGAFIANVPAPAAVPEPAIAALVTTAALLLTHRRKNWAQVRRAF